MFRVCLNCIELRHGCVVKNTVFLGKCTSLRNASLPRCSYAKPAFIKNRCRFGSFLELRCGLEMALASNRQWNGSINRFWNAFGSDFVPHSGPIGLHLGFACTALGPILATPGPHWAPFAPNFDPLGSCQLHEHLTRAHLSSICAPAAHLSFI